MRERLIAAVLLTAVASPAAMAHHSFAMFDTARQVTLSGTVREFQWTNPHSWLQLDVQGTEYSIELGSPNTLSRRGWRRVTFKPGDKVSVVINPMRDGSAGGALVSAVDAQGNTLSTR